MIRKPVVAGQFYPANPSTLRKELEALLKKDEEKKEALGLVSPHAGYIFSGGVAAACFSKIRLTETVVILGPNHTGLGAPFSIMVEGSWQTPLGNVEIDTPLAKRILKGSEYLEEDLKAHKSEHSIEVQLPFMQFFMPEVKIIPVVVSAADFKIYDKIGKAIAKAIKESKKDCLIIASSDMTHYQSQQKAQEDDKLAIQAILNLDGKELLRRVEKFNISMCGYGPTVCMLSATKELGARSARLIKYQTSGDAFGDYSSVVGYAGIMIV